MIRNLFAATAVALLVTACSSGIDTSSDWDPSADFSAYQTYAWVAGADQSGFGSLVDSRIKAAIEANLNSKGLRPATRASDADLGVGFQVSTAERSSFQTINSGWPGGYYGGYGYGGWGGGTSTTYETSYTEGSLIIGLFDIDGKQMVWQGVGTGTVDTGARSPEERTERINEAVAKVMEDFPPS